MTRRATFLLLIALSFTSKVFGDSDKYRLSLRNDPATTMVVGWNAVSGNNHRVYYDMVDHGTDTTQYAFMQGYDVQHAHKGMTNTFARLSGLQPNTAYYFVVADDQAVSQRFWFKTAPATDEQRLPFIAGGDSRNNRSVRQNANQLVAKLRPLAVFFGGDMTSLGSNGQWQDWFDDWQLTIAQDGRMFPIIPARGNHELSNDAISQLFDTNSDVYYGLTFGGDLFRMYTLNTESSIAGNQSTWLDTDLASHQNVIWKAAQYHRPMRPHVSSKSENNDAYNSWSGLFYQHGVDMVVECDAHDVKTTWPIKPSTGAGNDEGFVVDSANGTVYTGEGCWGAPIRNNDDDKSWTRRSGMFNQFKWFFVDKGRIVMRTIKVDNADQVGSVSDDAPFTPPANLNIWSPGGEEKIIIDNPNYEPPIIQILEPSNHQHFQAPQQILIKADVVDPDGVVERVEFHLNDSLIRTDSLVPYEATPVMNNAGEYFIKVKAWDNDGIMQVEEIRVTAGNFQMDKFRMIGDANDDAEEGSGGGMSLESSDIELINDVWGGNGDQTVGLRFQDVPLLPGATVDSAFVQFTVDSDDNGGTTLQIHGEKTGNAAVFSSANNDITSRTTTDSSVSWSPAPWAGAGTRGEDQRTPDISPILEELLGQGSWAYENSMALIISGSGVRTAMAYDNMSDFPAELQIFQTIGDQGNFNEPPWVSLVAPFDGEVFSGISQVTLESDAQDNDGNVQEVAFFIDGTLVGNSTSSPYTHQWNPPANGFYELQAIAVDDDQDSSTTYTSLFQVQNLSSQIQDQHLKDFSVHAYPLPVQNKLFLNIAYPGKGKGMIKMYDSNGQVVRSKSISCSGSARSYLDCKALESGSYYLVVNIGAKKAVEKIVK